ncbi:hypothetical protein E4U43_004870 [Claviceps pusilla]|uniref:threonine--tRNA ligase n=1 Tax=Claviceps pusilla TaxID=123648 RepID=A0A9P7N5A6_9HYPO|nr:hypothetical protein E4U43_004870 [Claviceps pusilla]
MITTRLRAPAAARRVARTQWTCPSCFCRRPYSSKQDDNDKNKSSSSSSKRHEPPDHRKLGQQQELFITSVYSPGSPIFLPHGTRIFNRLVDFLRKQYVRYGFQEVITPTIYKKALWAKSGHLDNYADDMYSVTGGSSRSSHQASAEQADEHGAGQVGQVGHPKEASGCCDDLDSHNPDHDHDDASYGLKPMNCPGHCLIFASKTHSYRDLPVRYADFSPLHRNEISGALSGLTRVRRFHQDDGHIFCRPCQVEDEIKKTLDFVKVVYTVLRLGVSYRLALSTRPRDHFIGTTEEWDRAEHRLRRALDASGMDWSVNPGDGAFYGPKIDIVIKDSDGKEHQTATIQLDFQLPKRFELEYLAPAPEYEARGETTTDPALLAEYGPVRPVMIHRAVLGSVERLMALLIESCHGKWPFWLNPRQVIILTVNTSQHVLDWADQVRDVLLGLKKEPNEPGEPIIAGPVNTTGLAVDVDYTARSLGSKIREARAKGYSQIVVIGEEDVKNHQVSLGNERMRPTELRQLMRTMADAYM